MAPPGASPGPASASPLPSGASVRPPAVARTFSPADPARCRAAAAALVAADPHAGAPARRPWFGAVVPHAGWVCSGAIAGEAIGTLAARAGSAPDVVVVFGAIHT